MRPCGNVRACIVVWVVRVAIRTVLVRCEVVYAKKTVLLYYEGRQWPLYFVGAGAEDPTSKAGEPSFTSEVENYSLTHD